MLFKAIMKSPSDSQSHYQTGAWPHYIEIHVHVDHGKHEVKFHILCCHLGGIMVGGCGPGDCRAGGGAGWPLRCVRPSSLISSLPLSASAVAAASPFYDSEWSATEDTHALLIVSAEVIKSKLKLRRHNVIFHILCYHLCNHSWRARVRCSRSSSPEVRQAEAPPVGK